MVSGRKNKKNKEAIILRAAARGVLRDPLRSQFELQKEIPPGLMVLLMQMEDKKQRRKGAH